MIKCKFIPWINNDGKISGLSINLPEGMLLVSGIIMDDYDGKGLLDFIDLIINGRNEKKEYWTNGYTARVVEIDDKNMIEISFRLTNDYEPYFIGPTIFKEFIGIWISEKDKFDKNPLKYKENFYQIIEDNF